MLKRYELPPCPVETSLMLMGDRWKVLIVRDLLTGTKRFGELKKSLNGISLHIAQKWTARSQKKDHSDAKKGPLLHVRGPVVLSREGWRFF